MLEAWGGGRGGERVGGLGREGTLGGDRCNLALHEAKVVYRQSHTDTHIQHQCTGHTL